MMKKLILFYLILGTLVLSTGCKKNVHEGSIFTPVVPMNIKATPEVGSALISWDKQDTATYMYLEISYDNLEGKIIKQNVGSDVNSVLIGGLLNKYEYTFTVTPYNRGISKIVAGTPIQISTPIRPIKRPTDVVYFPNDLTGIEVNSGMIDTYTQELTEGPKENLVDGDPNTYWHSAWSAASNPKPLPHWIQVNFSTPQEIGVVKYWLRQGGANPAGFPSQIALETSEDGVNWDQVWVSDDNLPTANPGEEHVLNMGKNFAATHFRVVILQNPGGTTWTNLGEISFYNMRSEMTDQEKLAEDRY